MRPGTDGGAGGETASTARPAARRLESDWGGGLPSGQAQVHWTSESEGLTTVLLPVDF